MDKNSVNMGLEGHMAIPLHLQRLERSLNIQPFMNQVNNLFQDQLSNDGMSSISVSSEDSNSYSNHVLNEKEEERVNKLRLYNMDTIGEERRWLQDILLSDSSDSSQSDSETETPITEEYFQDMLKFHILRKKYQGKFYQKPENIQYQYYGAGLLSNTDRFPEHQKLIVGNKKRKEKKSDKKTLKVKKTKLLKHHKPDTCQEHDYPEEDWDKIIPKEEELDEAELEALMKQPKSRGRKKHNPKTPEMMAIRRRKIWIVMSKKELGKLQRSKTNNHKEMLISCKKVAQHCMKYWRQKAMQSQKNMKETIWRAKRLTREMQSYWKRYDRVERETRRRLEKEAEEQRKMDVELIEAKRQQRKLNFLITQTELYAHFMSKKISKSAAEEQVRILNQLDEEKNPRLIGIDNYDSEAMKQKAKKNAMEAFDSERARTRQFDCAAAAQELRLSDTGENLEHPQPSIFKGNLKGYQLKGMNWLANLYDQGISGILADEMGLGKTVQSIAFLCHIAERYSVWGPFLIISPASTLHNWQQEMARFVPNFKVVPYWGNPQERKILRQFWDTKDLHTKDASFHVVITSYQLVITDYKYFNRIKWQYMILDEAQAIKSTSSMRWKLLLGFSCRNRLLLSGTPIQNSMAELWALLHFIMPTLFDSHDEFNEWFSKDIESHAENKTGIDEKHLSRLHMILKPFMLRRIKKDVENELSDKIEVMVYCPLTTRQKLLYSALKQKIRIEDLLYYTVGGDTSGSDKNLTSNLMNLVMQFRKVCNHPELFERRDAKSPLSLKSDSYNMPVLLYTEGLLETALPSKDHILYNKSFCFAAEYVGRSLHGNNRVNRSRSMKIWDNATPMIQEINETSNKLTKIANTSVEISKKKHGKALKQGENICKKSTSQQSCFSFAHLIGLSPMEIYHIFTAGILFRLCHAVMLKQKMQRKMYWEDWSVDERTSNRMDCSLLLIDKCERIAETHSDLFFTKNILQGESIYTHTDYKIHSVPETMAHRILRSSKHPSNVALKFPRSHGNVKPEVEDELKLVLLPEHRHYPRPVIVRKCQLTNTPMFLLDVHPKVQVSPRSLYVSNAGASCAWRRHLDCGGVFGQKVLRMGCTRAMTSSPDIEPILGVKQLRTATMFSWVPPGGLEACAPVTGWSNVIIPDKQTLVTDAGKLSVLDNLLKRLKEQGHRVLIYSQMTKMIDLLEEYMYYRKHTFMRLDGSSKISDRRDMVADFQKRADIFVFLLSTRAGGLGINLTAADTVIFYDSDWNPTVDQQAMDRAHRLGQTKQVTVYRLICKGTIEERILQRAREKSEIQRMVISGGNFKPDTLKPKEVVSLLLDDEEIEAKYSQRSEERKQYVAASSSNASVVEDTRSDSSIHHKEKERKRKLTALPVKVDAKRLCLDDNNGEKVNEASPVAASGELVNQQGCDQQEGGDDCGSSVKSEDETSNEGLVVDVDGPVHSGSSPRHIRPVTFNEPPKVSKLSHHSSFANATKIRPPIRGTSKRGRPRGSRRGGSIAGKGRGTLLPVMTGHNPGGPSDNLNQPGAYAGSIEGDSQTPSTNSLHHQSTVAAGRGLATVRRGPGRPRLRPAGPGNQGYRAPSQHYGKRIQRPLPVPLRSNQLSTTSQANSSANSGGSLVSAGQVASNSSTAAEPRPFGFYTQQSKSQMQ